VNWLGSTLDTEKATLYLPALEIIIWAVPGVWAIPLVRLSSASKVISPSFGTT
jgi:hypothetical protein